jgi:hypothetical protein
VSTFNATFSFSSFASRGYSWREFDCGSARLQVVIHAFVAMRGSLAMLAILHGAGLDLVVAPGTTKYQLACVIVVAKFVH